MNTRAHVVALAAVLLLTLCPVGGPTDPLTGTAVDGALLLNALATEIAKSLKAQANDLKAQRANLVRQRDAATGDGRQELTRQIQALDVQIQEMSSQSKLAEGDKAARAISSGMLTLYKMLGDAEQASGELNRWGPEIVDVNLMGAHQLASMRGRIQTASSIASVVGQIEDLRRAMREADTVATTPQSKKMVASLSMVLQGMQWIAKATPGIEPIIQQYGNAGQAMLLASARIEARIQQTQQGLFVQGRPDDGRLRAFDTQFPDLAEERDMLNIMPLPGVRDAYLYPRGDDGIVLIWDPAALRWHRSELDAAEVLRRYAFFASFGNLNPAPSEILGRLSDRVVGLTIAAEHEIVEPGGATLVHVFAQRLDGSEVQYLGVKLEVREEMLLMGAGDPGQVQPTIVDPAPEDVAVWQAPKTEHAIFTITASLADDEEIYQMVKPASCSVGTGGRTEIRASADPEQVEPGGDGTIEYQVIGADGSLVEPKADVTLFAEGGLEVEAGQWLSQTEAKGSAAYHAPREPGLYVVRIFFPGYIDAGYIFGKNYMSTQGTVIVEVPGEPEPVIAQADPDPDPDDDPPDPPVVPPVVIPDPPPQPQVLNLIPGTYYGGSTTDESRGKIVLVLSGDHINGIDWKYSQSWEGELVRTYSGRATPTGEIQSALPALGGYYQVPGVSHTSWVQMGVHKNEEGNWVATGMTFWPSGRPERLLGGQHLSLTKRQ